jgi:hypothetical protein
MNIEFETKPSEKVMQNMNINKENSADLAKTEPSSLFSE